MQTEGAQSAREPHNKSWVFGFAGYKYFGPKRKLRLNHYPNPPGLAEIRRVYIMRAVTV